MEPLRVLALRYASGQLSAEELPLAAAELLAAGQDGPALCDLAGRGRRESSAELLDLLREALAEAGVPYPEPADVDRWRLRDLVARLRDGQLTPDQTAAEAEQIGWDDGAPPELVPLLHQYCTCCSASYWTAEQYRAWADEVRALVLARAD